MTILCQLAAWPSELTASIGGDVHPVDDLDAALRALSDDLAENLIVVGPDAETD